jgi:hypothetical protein
MHLDSTQAGTKVPGHGCPASLRKGQFLGQNPSPTTLNILVDSERLSMILMRTVRVISVITKPVHIKLGRLRFLGQKHALLCQVAQR